MGAENSNQCGVARCGVFEKVGGILSLAFYAAQAVAMGGGLVVLAIGGKSAGDAWLRWTLPPLIAVAMALVFGMSAVGAAMAMWRVFREG